MCVSAIDGLYVYKLDELESLSREHFLKSGGF